MVNADICRKHEYIIAAEPQGRGAWHLHCVFIFQEKAPYMKNETVANLWRQGFVMVKKLDDVDNVGAYLTAYLGDMELTADDQINDSSIIKEVEYEENGEKKTKRYIKGARMSLYPPGFNIFRYSRGIKKPIVEEMSYQDAREKACVGAQTFSKAVKIIDDESGFKDTLVYEYYNALREKSQEEEQKTTEKEVEKSSSDEPSPLDMESSGRTAQPAASAPDHITGDNLPVIPRYARIKEGAAQKIMKTYDYTLEYWQQRYAAEGETFELPF